MAKSPGLYINTKEFLPNFKVAFLSAADPTDSLEACFNPESLELAVSCDIGRLGPVGWSHATQQYARTEPIDFPMHLEFSAMHMRDRLGGAPFSDDPQGPIRWFMKHCYGAQRGMAPDPIIVSWPGTLVMRCVLRGMNVSMKRWDSYGTLTNYSIDLDLTELRNRFRSAAMANDFGFDDPTELIQSESNRSGTPLNLGRTAKKYSW